MVKEIFENNALRPLTFKEMQIKIALRILLIPVRKATLRK